ncbi:LysR family transcriptional regulator [Salinarimonas soli]|uniref:LysR family transcriptional regulator n=1 Tax=Salinarimonas soli TaxID=1638099 RepID=A0A5B2V938_9HYPH|nr:LysR family transcriptional regulator [Salinarimonas soli]KAA2235534.1 LysR family transcriptional regulator [Salinarimonas soli]
MLELKEIETFLWVARLGGFRAAAHKLNTTQPSISNRIAAIEATLGVQLFDRGPQGTALTARGRELIGYAERMLALRAEIMRAVGSPDALRGVVRLGVSETIVHTWLSRLVERLHGLHPNVTLEIDVDTTPNLREGLLTQSLDVALLLGPLAEPRTKSLSLSTYPLSVVARADSALARGARPVGVEALRAQPVITYPRNTRPYADLRDLLSVPGEPAPRIYANASLSTIVRMALDGIGVAVIPAVLVEREVEAGDLVVVPCALPLAPLTFTATWLVDAHDHSALAVIAVARAVAREQPFAAEAISHNDHI